MNRLNEILKTSIKKNKYLNGILFILKIKIMTNSSKNILINLIKNKSFICFDFTTNNQNKKVVIDLFSDFAKVFHFAKISMKGSGGRGTILLRRPQAIIIIPEKITTFMEFISDKTRNMIRKAEKNGYTFNEFNYNNYLNDVDEINFSKKNRSGGEMHGWYTENAKNRIYNEQYYKFFGVFKDDKLVAYCHVVILNNFGFIRHFLGHANHLQYGIMNFLIVRIVEILIQNKILYLNYEPMDTKAISSMNRFKSHNGFESYAVFFKFDPNLKEINKTIHKFQNIFGKIEI